MERIWGPRILINSVGLILLLLIIFISAWARQQPYLGFDVQRSAEGKVVVQNIVNPSLVSNLRAGTEVVRIETGRGNGFALRVEYFSTSKIETRRVFPTRLTEIPAKAEVFSVLNDGDLRLITAEGEMINFELMDERPIDQLGSTFWVRLALGSLAVIMGALVWAWKPRQREHLLMLLSGSFLFLMTIPSAIDGIEMFVTSGHSRWFLDHVTLLGTIGFLLTSSMTLVYYPQCLAHANRWRNFIVLFFACFSAVVIFSKWNFSVPIGEQYLYATSAERYAAIVAGYLIILLLCCCQWFASRNKPLERMQSKSVILAWLTGPTILMLFYLVPIAYLKMEPPLSRTWAWGCITLSYLMVLIGVGRVKLFENERYVATVWQWLFITVLFVTMDLVLVVVLEMDPQVSSVLLFVVVLWFYVPLRQGLLRLFVGQNYQHYQTHFARGINLLTNYSLNKSLNSVDVWEQALKQIYNPIAFQWLYGDERTSKVDNSGQCLRVRASEFMPAAAIEFAERGTRLFNQQDVVMADSLVLFYEKLCSFQSAFMAGQQLERKRIGRDLHDQIGHDLLSLIYLAKDQQARQLAQGTMQRLREVIRALDRDTIRLDALANEISNIYISACSLGVLTPKISIHDGDAGHSLNSSVYLNVLNIFRELLSNTLKYAQAKTVSFSLMWDDRKVVFTHQDDGVGFDVDRAYEGFGLHNINDRAKEIQAVASWSDNGRCFRLVLNLQGVTGDEQ